MRSIIYYIISAVLVLTFLPNVICTASYMYWDSNFGPISLLSITSQSQMRQGSVTVTLNTSGNAQISADNTATAQLSCATDTLVTEYKLAFDGDGSTATGSADTEYAGYDSFLSTPSDITYITDDNNVDVTLWVRASNNPDNVADSDTYNATQTLTVSWVGP